MSTFADGFENKFSGKLKSMFSFSNLLKRDLTISDTRRHLSKTSELDCARFARALHSENKTKKYKNFATGA